MAFLSALFGAIVGGFLSLAGAWLTLKNQQERDLRADMRHLRDQRHDRLRAAFREVIVTAEGYANNAMIVGLEAAEANRTGETERLLHRLREGNRSDIGSRAILLLETDEDRALLEELNGIAAQHSSFVIATVDHYRRASAMTSEDFETRLSQMRAAADDIARLARTRLTQLEEPL